MRTPAEHPLHRPGQASAKSGFALIAAVMVGLTIMTLAAAWIAAIIARGRVADVRQNRLQAEYTARSGIVKFIRSLGAGGQHDVSTPQQWEEQVFADGEKCGMEASLAYGFAQVAAIGTSRGARHVERVRLGLSPDSLFPEALASADPRGVILEPGAAIEGDIAAPAAPQNWGGVWRGKHKTMAALIGLKTGSLDQALSAFQDVLSNPRRADVELFSTQVFGPERRMPPGRVIYVNDNILVESLDPEARFGETGPKTLAGTADVQVSGWARLEKITIVAAGRITVAGEASLADCILYSPQEIVITDNARFSGMLFSLMDIRLSGRAAVRGPALAYSPGNPSGRITVSDGTAFSGSIIFAGQIAPSSGVFIEPGASVNGLVYSSGNASIEGAVNGAAAAARLCRPGADTLQNNKLGGRIDRRRMPRMALPLCFDVKAGGGWYLPEESGIASD